MLQESKYQRSQMETFCAKIFEHNFVFSELHEQCYIILTTKRYTMQNT